MTPPAQKAPPRLLRTLARRLLHASMLAMLAFMGLVMAGRFLPLPSTLMLGRWATGGAVEREWRPLSAISPALVRAVIAAEDQKYCSHWGIDFGELNAVLSDPDGPSRGASTITMQTAKNAYLWPGRSILRKGLELPLALVLDGLWGKRRVMEVYLNMAEWGDGLYGAEAAARRYFGKPAAALSEIEAARLAAALPNPIERAAGQPSAASRRILARMEQIAPYAACVTD